MQGILKNGHDHYDLLGQLFYTGIATGFLQISSVEPTPNRDEEPELDEGYSIYWSTCAIGY